MEIIAVCLVLFFIFLLSIKFLKPASVHRRTAKKLPPGPKPYPIIGNILQIGVDSHRSFHKLSQTYGPIMSLYLGNKLAVVISSPEIAKDLIKSHDHVLTNRDPTIATQAHDQNKHGIIFRPTDSNWRKLRKMLKEHMLSTHCLDASNDLRQEMMRRLCDYLNDCSVRGKSVDVGEAAFITSLNLTSATIFSTVFTDYESRDVQEFRESIEGVMNAISTPNIADVFPILKAFDPQGIKKQADLYIGKVLSIFDGLMSQRLEARNANVGRKKDMLEALFDVVATSDEEFSYEEIKHLLLELYAGGVDTTSITVEWIMTELLRNPNVMSRVKEEITSVIGKNESVKESDISKLPYFKAVTKETLRRHPPGAFIARMPQQDIEINGYVIPKDSQIIINTFSLARDPYAWKNALAFDPERFMGAKNIEFKGQDFEFLPFGTGRRMCPGLPLADRMVHLTVATLVQKFDWKLEPGMKPEDLDIAEKPRLLLRKNIPLMAIPTSKT